MRCVALGWSLAFAVGLAGSAQALTWPDVPERIEKNLSSTDPGTRRAAAVELATLGEVRAAPLVLKALTDPDLEVRIAAADAAIRLNVRDATQAVIPWLGDRETRLRQKACDVARAMPDDRVVPQIARALGDNEPLVRSAAAEALAMSISPEAVPALLGKLDDQAVPVRIAIVRALARIGDKRAVVPLVGKVQDSVSDVRREVARALGDLGDTRASQAVLLQLRDNMPEVRVDALAALGRLHAADAVDAIAPLATDRSPALRQAAIGALGRIGTPEAVRVLASTLGSGDDAGGALESTPAREALVIAGPAAIAAMRDLLSSPVSQATATSAAWVLGQLHATTAANAIVAAMRRGTLPVAPALHALALAGGNDTLPVVLEFIGDPNPTTRAEAARAAGIILDPTKPDGRAVEPIEAALRDARLTTDERAVLAGLLGRTGAPRAAFTLASLTKSHDAALKLAAVDALGSIGTGAAPQSAALIELLADTDAPLRLRAAIALGLIGDATARDALLARLDTSEELDRAAVLTALAGILAREPSDPAVAKLSAALDLSVGPERDAILVALGLVQSPSAASTLTRAAKSQDADDRRTVATLLAGQPPLVALPLAMTLLGDTDAGVRAAAAWSLGTLGDAASVSKLAPFVRDPSVDVAIDAAGAIGRIAARLQKPSLASTSLCSVVDDVHAPADVRANALSGLAIAKSRCDGGTKERKALEDSSELVRLAAASVLHIAPTADDVRVLERCAAIDRSALVGKRCRTAEAVPTTTQSVLVYVVPDGQSTPAPHGPFLLMLADSLVCAGTTDRRGAVFEPRAPAGDVMLRRRSQ